VDPTDDSSVGKVVGAHFAVLALDDPTSPPWPVRTARLRVTPGPPVRDPSELWWIPGDVPGGVAGGYWLQLPDWNGWAWQSRSCGRS
jgi:hypothetical protein